MKIRYLPLIVLLVIVGCVPITSPTATLAPASPTPVADDLAPFRMGLVSASQNDLERLDRPTRYDLTLNYDPRLPTLAGMEQIRYTNRQSVPLSEIYLRLFANLRETGSQLDVTKLLLNGSPAKTTLEQQDTALRVALPTPLAPGGTAVLYVEFSVKIPRNAVGHYADLTANDGIVTLPSIFPLIPAYDSQGWHTEVPPAYGDLVYADMSLFSVTVTVPSALNVIASGVTVDKRDNGDGTTTWRLVGAPMRDFDLNLSNRLQSTSAVVGEITINSWYEPADAQGGKDALRFATDAVKIFQNRFGPYPYRELDVVETPTTAGGIEYPGLVVVAQTLYRGDRQREFFEFATVHEVSHQWWYGLVGNDQVNRPWLDEALAQYSTLIYDEDLRGKAAGQAVLNDYFMSLYNQAKAAGRDAAVDQPVAAYSEAEYSAIVYGKGPLFFDAIRKKMGDDKFYAFLKSYYQQYRYRIAFPADLLKSAETACACSLQDEYRLWIQSPTK